MKLFQAMTRRRLRKADGQETVGAVALDVRGTVAAGASTGGVDVMLPGRVGDTPLIGCGVYADDEAGAVSMTGLGESIVRVSAAKGIVDLLELGWSPRRAADSVLTRLVRRTAGSAGAIVVSPSGNFAIRHVTPRMAAGYWDGVGSPTVRDRFP
jgi:beta-aspartyl-peptidase (threonine type)